MAPMIRILASVLVAILLPVQGYAAACAQICAAAGKSAGESRVAASDAEAAHCHGDGAAEPAGGHEHGSAPHSDGKCCQAHVFAVDSPAVLAGSPEAGLAPTPLVARWTSFILDPPSPPPIGLRPIA